MAEENKSVGFNKRKAEGMDKNDKCKKTLRLKECELNTSKTICYLQILGTGMDTHDTLFSFSVLLFFDNQRFLFNVGEGLQRHCTEHKIKLSKTNHIFLSRVCSETTIGLPGLLFTLAGMGEGMSVNVHGPSGLKYLVDATGSFIPNAALVNIQSFGPSLGYDVTSMTEQSNFTGPIVRVVNKVVKISAIPLQTKFCEGKPGDVSVLYVCELPDIKGKFGPKKASALGVKAGPKYEQLKEGHSVKSDYQDIVVHPSDVMGPSSPGPIVLLVDCPTESHLQQLLFLECLNSYYADFSGSPESSKVLNSIIHLSLASLACSSNYQKWMKRFGSAQHIMAGHERKNVEIPIFKSSAIIAAILNYLCPQFFPAQGLGSIQHPGCAASNSEFTLLPQPKFGLDRSCIPNLFAPAEVIDDLLLEIPDIAVAAQYVSHLWLAASGLMRGISSTQDITMMSEESLLNEKNLPSCLENIQRDDLEVVFLGTGSSQPSKYRNVSSIHINLFSKGGLLLDCGEGTLGQLRRRYGVDGADKAVRGLRFIWISHIHADHHTGLARIFAVRRDLLKEEPHEPLLVIGPRQLKRFLDAYQNLDDLDMMFLNCWHTTEASLNTFDGVESNNNHFTTVDSINSDGNSSNKPTSGQTAQKIDSTLFAGESHMLSYCQRSGSPVGHAAGMKNLKKVLRDAGLEALISFPVVHCPQAFGVVLKAGERANSVGKVIPGWKVVYSGDTRPCQQLVEASHGATILIHEATFEDGMAEEAVVKTTAQQRKP